MTPGPLVPCSICEFSIGSYEPFPAECWTCHFRIVYKTRSGRFKVTGVGLYDNQHFDQFMAPEHFNYYWNDAEPEQMIRIGVSEQPSFKGRHGFPFHSACYHLLTEAYKPNVVSWRLLFNLFTSLSFPHKMVYQKWCASFPDKNGCLLTTDSGNCHLWENRFDYHPSHYHEVTIASQDPVATSEIIRLQILPEGVDVSSLARVPRRTMHPWDHIWDRRKDPFAGLPEEICVQIASFLPSAAASRARLASRSFVPIYSYSSFWASRFWPTGDRFWLFEARSWHPPPNWRLLYRRTSAAHCPRRLQNRSRVMGRVQNMQTLLSSRWAGQPYLPWSNDPDIIWIEAAASVNEHLLRSGLTECCRKTRQAVAALPRPPYRLVFSMAEIRDVAYIAGIKIVPLKDGQEEEVQLGYSTANKEITLDVRKQIIGLNVAASSAGIQGIRCIMDGGEASNWIGNCAGLAITQRLMACDRVRGIKAGFDGFKMVSLAVTGPLSAGPPWRESAFWFPCPPLRELHLINEASFTSRESAASAYHPLCWFMFSGWNGSWLPHLTKMSVTCSETSIRGIRFQYTGEGGSSPRAIGKGPRRWHVDRRVHFDIDGPGGEIITAIEVFVRPWDRELLERDYAGNKLVAFAVFTNHKRRCRFGLGKKHLSSPGVKRQRIEAPIGSRITGLYYSEHLDEIVALGAISQVHSLPTLAKR